MIVLNLLLPIRIYTHDCPPPFSAKSRKTRGGTVRFQILAIFGPRFWPFYLVKSLFRDLKIAKFSRLRRVFPLLQPLYPYIFFAPAARLSEPRKDPLFKRFPLTRALKTPKFSPPAARSSRSQNLRIPKVGGDSQKGGTAMGIYPDTF